MNFVRWIAVSVAAAFLVAAAAPSSAQIQYRKGQDVTPAFEGWMPNSDGTFSLYFGYMNRNYEEEVDVPLGPDNSIDPGGDRGQPTHFYPRRQSFVFKVVVPKDWGREKKVVWTLVNRGHTNAAKGWLQPEWEINKEIMMENSDDGGGADLENQPPTISGPDSITGTVSTPVALTVTASDDGRPRSRNGRGGLTVRWMQYRGTGPVAFDSRVGLTTKASFSAPGTYVLRALASDGSLTTPHDITVTVK
jgi:hypothetical protein